MSSAFAIGAALEWAIGRMGDRLLSGVLDRFKDKRARAELSAMAASAIEAAATLAPEFAEDLRSGPFAHNVLAPLLLERVNDPTSELDGTALATAYLHRFVEHYMRGRGEDETLARVYRTNRPRLVAALCTLIVSFDRAVWQSENWREAAKDRAIEEMQENIRLLVARTPSPTAFAVEVDIETARADAVIGSQDLLEWPRHIAGLFIERPELDRLLRRVVSEPRAQTLVVGEAGSGKSALLSELAEHLQREGLTVFAIKADKLPPEVRSTDDLSKALGLKGNIEVELDLLARTAPLVLIVDQLDAVSEVMDRSSQRMRLLLNLANRFRTGRRPGGEAPPVHVIVSSRPFEAAHDGRFQSLQAEAIKLSLPAYEKVEALLGELGIESAVVPEGLKETLRRPFALRLFVDLVRRGRDVVSLSATELLDVWLATADLGGLGLRPRVVAFLERLASDMTEHETLWRPADAYEALDPDAVRQSEASGLVLRRDKVLGFSHQSWLDDFQAKGLASSGEIAAFAWARQDGLFARTTVLRSLQRLRSFDTEAYGRALDALLGSADTRRHLRHLVVDLVASQDEPTHRERAWVQRLIREDVALARRALSKVAQRWAGWRSDIEPLIPAVMRNDSLRWSAVQLLTALSTIDLPAAHNLISTHWSDETFDGDVFQVFWRSASWSQEVAGRLRSILERQSIQSFAVSAYAADIAKKGLSKEASELLLMFLGSEPAKKRDRLRLHGVDEVAMASPVEFAKAMLPWFLGIATEGIDLHPSAKESYARSLTLPYTWDDDEHDDSVFRALKSSLITCAQTRPELAEGLIAQLTAHPVDELQALAAEIYASNPSHFAEEAVRFLLSDDRRLCVGHAHVEDMYEVGHLIQGWSTHLLIRALVPHLQAGQLESLRDCIERWHPYRADFLAHLSVTERRDRRAWSEESRLELLSMLPAVVVGARRARQASEWLALQPKFTGKRGTMAHWVGSPMSADQMAKATDDDLVRMLGELCDGTRREGRHRRGRSVSRGGGASELGQAFARFGKAHPDRALKLVRERLSPEKHQNAVGALLQELGKDDARPARPLIDLICELHNAGYDSTHWRHQAAWALDSMADRAEGLSDFEVDLLESWLCNEPSEIAEQITRRENHEELNRQRNADRQQADSAAAQPVFFGRGGGLNILPQDNFTILSAMHSGLMGRPERPFDAWLAVLERHLARAEDPAIWRAVLAYRGRSLYWADRTRTQALLDELWRKYPAAFNHRALRYLWPCRAMMSVELRRSVIRSWSVSEDAEAQQAAGEFSMALALVDEKRAFFWNEAQSFLDSGPMAARLGCIFSAASAWRHNDGEPRAKSHELLLDLAPAAAGDEADAWSSALDGSRTLAADSMSKELLWAAVDNPTLLRASLNHMFVDALQELLLHPGFEEVVLAAAEKSVEALLGQGQRRSGMIDGDLVAVAVALQRSSGSYRSRAMDLYERLLDAEVYGADKAAAESLRN